MSTPAERLRRARERAGISSAKAAAEGMGVAVSTYIQHESGVRGIPAGRAARYAQFFRSTPEWLLYGRGQEPEPSRPEMTGMRPITRLVPVMGVVQAGAWVEIPDDPEPEEMLPVLLPAFEGAQLFAVRVQGPSMNQFYPEGTRVVVCPAAEIGVSEGDHVVVRRRRGVLVETTLKEVVRNKKTGEVELWPRSTDPAFKEPFRIAEARDADDGPEIIAVVVASYAVRPQRRGPLLQF